jgi:type I restriction enzyme, R subunit
VKSFTEDSRVKIPALLHLTRLGYTYLSLKKATWDESTNIFTEIFRESLARINPNAAADDIDRAFQEISLTLDNEDLGKAFFERLTRSTGLRLVDFEDFDNNSFHVVTELTCKNGDDEFRPDITLLVNGLPLVFTEVKKPNNRDGILDERTRINRRFRNPKFRRFVNITQLMVFSNNMEYDDDSPEPLEGAFYASPSYGEPDFNYFREGEERDLAELLAPEDEEIEDIILKDNNLSSIKHAPEFAINKAPETPTNRLLTAVLAGSSRLSPAVRLRLRQDRQGN